MAGTAVQLTLNSQEPLCSQNGLSVRLGLRVSLQPRSNKFDQDNMGPTDFCKMTLSEDKVRLRWEQGYIHLTHTSFKFDLKYLSQ